VAGAATPEPPESADPRELPREVRAELRSLTKPVAEWVARHLVAAGDQLDRDPEAALAHARAARSRAARIGSVREAVGIAAYRAGAWAESLAELRTARRLTGDLSFLPMIADAERGLGRPERALALARSPEVATLPAELRVEMRIVEAGARRDLGEPEAALVILEAAQAEEAGRDTVEPWTPRLWYAYADALLAVGRAADARRWFQAVATVDEERSTDADERLLELDQRIGPTAE
jgi:tetratricopeptide (TPR) repeat protein